MIAGLNYGLKWKDTLKLANACGAACCEILGATPDLAESRSRVFELYDGAPFDEAALKRHRAPRTLLRSRLIGTPFRSFSTSPSKNSSKLRAKIGDENYFKRAADLITLIESRGGRIHVTGIGKPEYVAGYVSALLSSTGAPAYFLHGTECVHGSAGQVVPGDLVIAISNSGETVEMRAAITALKRNGALVLGVSGNPDSWLARSVTSSSTPESSAKAARSISSRAPASSPKFTRWPL